MPCRNIALLDNMLGADSGGTWTYLGYNVVSGGSPGAGGSTVGTLTGDNPEVDFEDFTPGTYFFRYTTGTGDCISNVTLKIRVKQRGTAGEPTPGTYCTSATSTITLASLLTGESSGGQWILNTGSPDDPGGAFNAGAGTL